MCLSENVSVVPGHVTEDDSKDTGQIKILSFNGMVWGKCKSIQKGIIGICKPYKMQKCAQNMKENDEYCHGFFGSTALLHLQGHRYKVGGSSPPEVLVSS